MTSAATPGSNHLRPTQEGLHPDVRRNYSFEIGLFILRGAALLVLGTWGWMKFHSLINIVHSGRPLANSGFVRLIRQLGFPFPRFMAVCAIINESVVSGLLFLGTVTRPAALVATLGMAGAWYSSIRLGEEPLRAALCMAIFGTLAFTGAGQYSIDRIVWHGKNSSIWRDDIGLLILRVGAAGASLSLAIVPTAKDPNLLAFAPAAHWPLVLACLGGVIAGFGFFTRTVSGALSIFWLVAIVSALHAGIGWNMSPIRAALFATIFAALTFTGPGRMSLAFIYKNRTAAAPQLELS